MMIYPFMMHTAFKDPETREKERQLKKHQETCLKNKRKRKNRNKKKR